MQVLVLVLLLLYTLWTLLLSLLRSDEEYWIDAQYQHQTWPNNILEHSDWKSSKRWQRVSSILLRWQANGWKTAAQRMREVNALITYYYLPTNALYLYVFDHTSVASTLTKLESSLCSTCRHDENRYDHELRFETRSNLIFSFKVETARLYGYCIGKLTLSLNNKLIECNRIIDDHSLVIGVFPLLDSYSCPIFYLTSLVYST